MTPGERAKSAILAANASEYNSPEYYIAQQIHLAMAEEREVCARIAADAARDGARAEDIADFIRARKAI